MCEECVASESRDMQNGRVQDAASRDGSVGLGLDRRALRELHVAHLASSTPAHPHLALFPPPLLLFTLNRHGPDGPAV